MSNALHVALAVLAMIGVAHAQNEDDLSLTVTSAAFATDEIKVIGGSNCASQIAQTLNINGTLTNSYTNYTLRLTWTTGTSPCSRDTFANCSNTIEEVDDETCGCITEADDATSISSSAYNFGDLLETACEQDTGESSVRFYLEYYGNDDSVSVNSAPVEVTFDFEAPDAPVSAPTVTPSDGGLAVSFPEANDADIDYYEVCYFKTGTPTCVETSDESQRLSGLDNGETYTVYYQIVDYAGNVSLPSPSVMATPEESQDFAEFYSNIPGRAQGCDARPGHDLPGWLWFTLPALAFVRRRRSAGLLLGLMVLMSAWPAAAREDETPRSAVFEFRMGSYLPNIDGEFGDACATQNCPYAAAFEAGDPLMLTFTYSRHIFTEFGTLSAGGGFGYWNNDEGRAIRSQPSDELDYAEDTTEISVYPLFLELSYRFDIIQDIIPLVPALKVGLDAYGWRIFDGAGDVARFHEFGSEADAGAAAGISYGWHASLGVHILLDFFSPGMAADFDRDAGVNNSYLTLDYQTSQISNFGAGETLWLGSDVLFIGLALDM